LLRRLGLATVLVALMGCEDGTGPVPASTVGTYALVSVGGAALPAALGPATAQQITATRGDLVLRADGDYLQVIQTSYLDGNGQQQTGTNMTLGDFSVNGSRIELEERLGPRRVGAIAQGNIEYSIDVSGSSVALEWQK
jgi:hypothetical protein